MPQAIVSVIDPPFRQSVEDIWGELRAVFGLQGAAQTRPHFTYQWAESYGEGLEAALGRIAAETAPFDVETHGLGIFRGSKAVVYMHLDINDSLRGLHQRLWRDAGPLARAPSPVLAIESWVPHITLAVGDLTAELVPDVMALLGRRGYRWRVPVTNLCLVPDESPVSDWLRFELRGGLDAASRPASK